MRSHVGPLSKLPVSPRLQSERKFAHAKCCGNFSFVEKRQRRLDLGQYSTTPKSTAFDPRYASQPNFLERLEDPRSLSCQISSSTDRAFPFCNKSISSQFLSIARPRSWWCSPGELPPPPWQTLGSWLLLLNRICELCFTCFTCCLCVKCLFFWMLGIFFGLIFFSQQRKLMGSSASAQTSSGVHWYRRRVRFNEVPETVPKVPEKV